MRFSERHGHSPVRTAVQRESLDDRLRNGIWNVMYALVLDPLQERYYYGSSTAGYDEGDETFVRRIWEELGQTIDTAPNAGNFLKFSKKFITESKYPWFVVYDFVEFVAQEFDHLEGGADYATFTDAMNLTLEKHTSAYRLVGGKIVDITSKDEIQAIEGALETEHSPVAEHLSRALRLLSDREDPDYRNSIKESISAVESLCKMLSGNPKASIKDALSSIDAETHPALTQAFNKLYGYTSDADGIRHAMLKDSTVDAADATFMLVACSAFVNYLTAKSAK